MFHVGLNSDNFVLIFFFSESSPPMNIFLTFNHAAYVKGDHTNFKIESSFGVEASALYPNVKYITVDEYLNKLI